MLYQLQASCDMLETNLRDTFGNAKQNNLLTYVLERFAEYNFNRLQNDPGISSFNNILVGNNVNLTGTKNIVVTRPQ